MHKTALNAKHREHGAKLVEFGGWEMPVQYTGIVAEHEIVRNRAGLFDLQHMGRLKFTGPDRAAALDSLLSNDVPSTKPGRAKYAVLCLEDGNALDDAIFYVLEEAILLVVNASNRDAVLEWIRPRLEGFDVTLSDETFRWAMLAVQGPKSAEVLQPLTHVDLAKLKYYRCTGGMVLGEPCFLARTGYTGEVGYELVFDARVAETMWDDLLRHGAAQGLAPCGLAARDTLRLEAGMALYGHELDRHTNPLEAGLDFAVRLDAGDFVGRDALLAVKERGPAKTLVGFTVEGKRIPRQGAEVLHEGEVCGVVTSGTKSPTVEKLICMAYVPSAKAGATDGWEIQISSSRYALTPTKLPFYSRTRGA
ncbi:MAG: glycine cleavage system aminomethyltransferase GcvT [Planctomycetes bacterium]|nr:glycine cleavage system aminomethyltransferase GcvT [Planctomycetota bacterium]